ncbi:mitochondrial carrier protein [Aspergillus floccosus]
MPEYKVQYNSELDSYSLYHRYEETPPKEDWKTAALRGPALPALGNAAAGAVGAAISNLATYPLSLIIARLQTQKQQTKPSSSSDEEDSAEDDAEEYTGVLDAARKIYAAQGLSGFYTGLAQDTAKTVADSFLFFLAYEFFRQRRLRARFGAAAARRTKHLVLPVLDELAVGVLAGAFAKLFTTPLANIVARKQVARGSTSTREIAARIRAEKGLRGFWSGYSASLILTLNPSLTFFLNGFLKMVLRPRGQTQRPLSPALTFLLAALSKSAASTVTYPFSMAKTRAQVTGSAANPAPTTKNEKDDDDDGLSLMPAIVSHVVAIARAEGISALYAGLPGEVAKGFFSHGFTMLAKDAVYAAIVKAYYLLLIVLRRYPTPDELIERARLQAEEWAEAAREGARDLADEAGDALGHAAGNAAVDMTSSASGAHYETAEMVHDYVEDEEGVGRGVYHWFWEDE